MKDTTDRLAAQNHPIANSALPPGTAVTDEDQFDADAYVKQLIQRMGGNTTPAAQPVTTPSAPTPQKPTPPNASAPKPVTAVEPMVKRLTRAEEMGLAPEAVEATMRRSSPEKTVDLERLREAANLTSHHDLHRSDCNGLIYRAYYQLLLTIVCMVLSLVLVGLSKGPLSAAYFSSLALLGLSTFFAFRYTATTRVLTTKLRGPARNPTPEAH
jgi:hypothetical protein